jgi:hypothetical protein
MSKPYTHDELLETISDIIYADTEIHLEYGEDMYVKNHKEIAERIIKVVEDNTLLGVSAMLNAMVVGAGE